MYLWFFGIKNELLFMEIKSNIKEAKELKSNLNAKEQ